TFQTLTLEGDLPGQMGDLRTASITDPAAEQTASSITSSGTTATVTLNGHGFHAGDTVVLTGAAKATNNAYNGTFVISSVTTNTFQVTLDSSHTGSDTGASLRAVRPLETSYYRY